MNWKMGNQKRKAKTFAKKSITTRRINTWSKKFANRNHMPAKTLERIIKKRATKVLKKEEYLNAIRMIQSSQRINKKEERIEIRLKQKYKIRNWWRNHRKENSDWQQIAQQKQYKSIVRGLEKVDKIENIEH